MVFERRGGDTFKEYTTLFYIIYHSTFTFILFSA